MLTTRFRCMLSLPGFNVMHVLDFWFFTDFLIFLHVYGQRLYLLAWITSLDLVQKCLTIHTTWHSPHHSLGSFWLPWIFMFRSLSLELLDSPCWSECAVVASWISSWPFKPYPFRPTIRLSSFPFVIRKRLLYCSYLYISLYSCICAYQGCNIHVILYHILW